MLPLVESPKKPVVGSHCYYSAVDTTPRAQVTNNVSDLPSMKLGHKTSFRFPGYSKQDNFLESPSKPSKSKNSPPGLIIQSPDLVSDEDTLSDSSIGTNGMASPSSELFPLSPILPELVPDKYSSLKLNLDDSPSANEYFSPSRKLSGNSSAEGSLVSSVVELRDTLSAVSSDFQSADILPFFQSPKKRFRNTDSNLHTPKRSCHEDKKPHYSPKSILKLPQNSNILNFVVTSTNGSVVDATIFATEINSCSDSIPLPANAWEKVTIPVNVHVKENFKKGKGKMIGGYYDSDEDIPLDKNSNNFGSSTLEDAAIIRGYEFHERKQNFSNTGKGSRRLSEEEQDGSKKLAQKKAKVLRWADFART